MIVAVAGKYLPSLLVLASFENYRNNLYEAVRGPKMPKQLSGEPFILRVIALYFESLDYISNNRFMNRVEL